MMIKEISYHGRYLQRGVAAVEFALVAGLLFILLFGIIELGRLFYVFNTVQEVTRHAAREAAVKWRDQENSIKTAALFGGASLPAGAEIRSQNINIEYLTAGGALPASKEDNILACAMGTSSCIRYVRVSIINARYAPMVGFFSGIRFTGFPFSEKSPFVIDLRVPIPASTVTMPAESMGYTG